MYTTRRWSAGVIVVAAWAAAAMAELPAAFDWRNQGACTPPKLVQACARSQWAFGSVAVMESAILIKDGESTDLSEQWLISCNTDGVDCLYPHWQPGFAYFQYRRDPCGDTGPVLETDFPFDESGSGLPCDCPYPHQPRYMIDHWRFVATGSADPTVAQIKQAIFDHGLVLAGIHVNSAFVTYFGGIFNTCEDGPIDQAVVLVGWDDNQGPAGVWFLRNAWGTFWGESGYMRIAYGCNRVGYGACYIDYPGAHDLDVTPYNDALASFVSRGPIGGPFQPACATYVLTNRGSSPMTWTAAGSHDWLEVTPDQGTLPAFASTPVDVCIASQAGQLPAGAHSGTVTFTNATAGKVRKRLVSLDVDAVDRFTEYFEHADNDLDNTMLTFMPDGSPGFYRVCVEPITELPSDPAQGTALPNMGHDKYNTVSLTGGKTVSLYGASYSTFYVSTNGYVTFTAPDADRSESWFDHFRVPRVSALYETLYVLVPGIMFQQRPDRAVMTYMDVTQDDAPGTTNRFQIELFYDGRIRLSYLNLDCPSGLVGLSAGAGIPVDLIESDLSAAGGPCLPDLDLDNDLDQEDFGGFQRCLNGPTEPFPAPVCHLVDVNEDGHIDSTDATAFLDCMTGPNGSFDPGCWRE